MNLTTRAGVKTSALVRVRVSFSASDLRARGFGNVLIFKPRIKIGNTSLSGGALKSIIEFLQKFGKLIVFGGG